MKREPWSQLEMLLVFVSIRHAHWAGEAGGSLHCADSSGAHIQYSVAIFIERPGLIKATMSLMDGRMDG